MRTRLEEQLEVLNREMITMGAMCEDAIGYAMEVLLAEATSKVARVEQLEEDIDQMQRDVEGLCTKLLISQQPVAKDLRVISSAMRMVADMERIGDQAQDIAEIAQFCRNNLLKHQIRLDEMAVEAAKMLTNSVDAFVRSDTALAQQVIDNDDVVDGHFSRIKKELLVILHENVEQEESCFDLLMVAKYLERIGDHATNLAEQVIAMQ